MSDLLYGRSDTEPPPGESTTIYSGAGADDYFYGVSDIYLGRYRKAAHILAAE
jgi:hypothetical protein